MAKYARCKQCNATTPRHCNHPQCPWVDCPTHGRLALTAEERKLLGGFE